MRSDIAIVAGDIEMTSLCKPVSGINDCTRNLTHRLNHSMFYHDVIVDIQRIYVTLEKNGREVYTNVCIVVDCSCFNTKCLIFFNDNE